MKSVFSATIPIRLLSEANTHEHWTKTRKRRLKQQNAVAAYLNTFKGKVKLPCIIRLIRIAPRTLDFDNFVYSMKAIRDACSEILIPGLAKGRADGDARIMWEYVQEKGRVKEYAFRIEIYEDDELKALAEQADIDRVKTQSLFPDLRKLAELANPPRF
jgi:hypothetical protein